VGFLNVISSSFAVTLTFESILLSELMEPFHIFALKA